VEFRMEEQQVVIESAVPSLRILEELRSTGKKVNISGQGENAAAICAFDDPHSPIKGVVRFVQANDAIVIIEGFISGLTVGLHGIAVHTYGDISRGSQSTGPHFNPHNNIHGAPSDKNKHAGDLGNILIEQNGSGMFRLETDQLKVWDIIGRSVVVCEKEDDLGKGNDGQSSVDGNCGEGVTCGIVARAASIGENRKKVCTCDDPRF